MEILRASEDYLESMLMMKLKHGYIRSIDVAEHLGVTKPSVTYATRRLKESGHITMDKDGLITLTETGMAVAAKMLDQVRPGGIVAFVTSRYTMDSKDDRARKYIAERAELLGAIRLPNNAFKANAGTDVVSDILFLQKREQPSIAEPEWTQLGENADGFSINNYFIRHPEMILGRQSAESTQYGKQHKLGFFLSAMIFTMR